ncbi:MAG: M23 family metallopeptidase [bacterium]
MTQSPSYFSVIIMPPHSGNSWRFKISPPLFFCSALFFIVLTTFVLFMSYRVFKSQSNFRENTLLKQKVTMQHKQMAVFNDHLDQLALDLEIVLSKENELNLLLDDIKHKGRYSKKKNSKEINFKERNKKLREQSSVSPSLFKQRLDYLRRVTEASDKHISLLSKRAARYKKRFSNTPSIWPTYGPVLSNYGYRPDPIHRNKRQFHRGIDIASRSGSPIKCTADGNVEFSGWARGFGNTIVVNHGFGYRTLYAHCSLLIAKRSKVVKKGEVIAFVGTTGRSTGPHLHYEIRRWHKSIKPRPFLDMDMFTASQKVW